MERIDRLIEASKARQRAEVEADAKRGIVRDAEGRMGTNLPKPEAPKASEIHPVDFEWDEVAAFVAENGGIGSDGVKRETETPTQIIESMTNVAMGTARGQACRARFEGLNQGLHEIALPEKIVPGVGFVDPFGNGDECVIFFDWNTQVWSIGRV